MNMQEWESADFEMGEECPFMGLKCTECSKNDECLPDSEQSDKLNKGGIQNEIRR